MEAIILAGGLGTRLRSVTGDALPKVIAPIAGRPFLAHLLAYLATQWIDRVVLAVGHKREVIREHFGGTYHGIAIAYSEEEQPLGTGGALRQALCLTHGDTTFALNGDSLFKTDLAALSDKLSTDNHDIVLALKPMDDNSRYGAVRQENGLVLSFEEKLPGKAGPINGGVYCLKTDLFHRVPPGERLPFSFEKYLEGNLTRLNVGGVINDAYFIDIGVPEDYARAQVELDNA